MGVACCTELCADLNSAPFPPVVHVDCVHREESRDGDRAGCLVGPARWRGLLPLVGPTWPGAQSWIPIAIASLPFPFAVVNE